LRYDKKRGDNIGTMIGTEEWLERNIGKGKRFRNLNDLLGKLKGIKRRFDSNCGYAGGSIDDEIGIIEILRLNEIKSQITIQKNKRLRR